MLRHRLSVVMLSEFLTYSYSSFQPRMTDGVKELNRAEN